MKQANRLLIIGCAAAAVGLAFAIFGAVGSSRDWVISALGLAAVVSALPSIAVALRAKRRSVTTRQSPIRSVGWRAVIGSYVEGARRSRRRRVLLILGALWIVYTIIALVVSIATSRWSYALVYGVVAAGLLALGYVRATASESPTA